MAACIVFGLRYGLRPHMWEGANRVDLMAVYCPPSQLERCQKDCLVDGISVAVLRDQAGPGRIVPISDVHPLQRCRHFLAGAAVAVEADMKGDSLEAFYNRFGVAPMGTPWGPMGTPWGPMGTPWGPVGTP